ncbi:uncharacterized protein [Medicago truncatula]|uniref:uncharacterized protein n=1 Tax=Medicago truncatula TaxID=3880 RepID=UPI000D2F38E4|nr:uncharacterized protein LOC25501462 [Medicago truncatula]
MDFSSSIISLLLHFLLISSLVCPINSSETIQQINKPAIKTIQISDGDIIDCILTHKQPAFDHPLLKGQKPLDPPERSKGHNQISNLSDIFQLWSLSGESCPEGTIPIRRTTEEDISRAGSIDSFGRKANGFRTDTIQNGHLHSVGFVRGDIYYGAQAIINVWAPHVESPNEFSLGQIWIVSGSGKDLNTIEVGWQVSAGRYGDNRPRLFTFWTADGYDQTGCYDLLCPGFVQTNNKFAIGTPISPISTYNGGQYEITLFIFKDPTNGSWWLEYGLGNPIGYWPSSLFTTLKDNATIVQFGGEIVNAKSTGAYTSTQMGSGHFAEEGYGKASYFRNMQVVGSKNFLTPLSNPTYTADQPNCYNVQGRFNDKWGHHFYYGGPGRNEKCP